MTRININNPLIPIYEDDKGFVVNARDLHLYLQIGEMFINWIKRQIEINQLIEGKDFRILAKFSKNSKGRPLTEYMLTLEAASYISQASHSNKGLEARKFFYECTIKYGQALKNAELSQKQTFNIESITKLQLAELLLESENEKEVVLQELKAKEEIIEQQKLQIECLKSYSHENIITITRAAKKLKMDPRSFMTNLIYLCINKPETVEMLTTYRSMNGKVFACIKKDCYNKIANLIKTVA